jgi:hypothetical protein
MAEHHDNISVYAQILVTRLGIGHFENHGDFDTRKYVWTCSATDKETLSECTELVSTTFLPNLKHWVVVFFKALVTLFFWKEAKIGAKIGAKF